MGSRWLIAPRDLIELGPVPEVYSDGLGAVERIGGNLRFHLFSEQGALVPEGGTQRVIVCRVLTPADILAGCIGQLAHCLTVDPGPDKPSKPFLVK